MSSSSTTATSPPARRSTASTPPAAACSTPGRAPAGLRRQGEERRRRGGAQGAGRRQGGPDRRHAADPVGVPAARRRRRRSPRNTWAAMQGRKELKIDWDDGPHATYDSDTYRAELESAARKPGKVVRNDGDVDAARWPRRRSASRPNTTCRISRTRRWSRRRRPPHHQRQVRGLGRAQIPQAARSDGRRAPRHAERERHRAT